MAGECSVAYDAPSNLMTLGATGAGTCNFTYLATWDAAQGPPPGVVTNHGNGQFVLTCELLLDNTNAVVFTDDSKQVCFDVNGWANYSKLIEVETGSELTLGVVDNEAGKTINRGFQLLVANAGGPMYGIRESGGTIRLYGVSVTSTAHQAVFMFGAFNRAWHCSFPDYVYFNTIDNTDIFNLVTQGSYYGIKNVGGGCTLEYLQLGSATRAVHFTNVGSGWLLSKLIGKDNTVTGYLTMSAASAQHCFNLLDDDIDTFALDVDNNKGGMGWFMRLKTCSTSIADPFGNRLEDVSLTVKDAGGNVVSMTDSGCDINEALTYDETAIIVSGSDATTVFTDGDYIWLEGLDFCQIDGAPPDATHINVTRGVYTTPTNAWPKGVYQGAAGGNIYLVGSMTSDASGDFADFIIAWISYYYADDANDVIDLTTTFEYTFEFTLPGYQTLIMNGVTGAALPCAVELQPLRTRAYGRARRMQIAQFT